MKLLAWILLIGFGIFVWSQADPESFQDAKDKLKDKAIEKVLNTNLTNESLVVETNITGVPNGTYSPDTTNYGRPKKIVEFLCATDNDCKTYIPDAPYNIECNKLTGECIK